MATRKNKFYGADDIYLTKKSICVTKISSSSKNGVFTLSEVRRYYPKTFKNLKLASSVHGQIKYKK